MLHQNITVLHVNVEEVSPLVKHGMASQKGTLIAKLIESMPTHFLVVDITESKDTQHITVQTASGGPKKSMKEKSKGKRKRKKSTSDRKKSGEKEKRREDGKSKSEKNGRKRQDGEDKRKEDKSN